jgi:hypothetical protein
LAPAGDALLRHRVFLVRAFSSLVVVRRATELVSRPKETTYIKAHDNNMRGAENNCMISRGLPIQRTPTAFIQIYGKRLRELFSCNYICDFR